NCTTCHYETQSISAPSVVEFKTVYLKKFVKKEDFVESMAKWVQYPNAKTTLMPKAVAKHGLMPELGFDLETLKSISSYIYDTNFYK
ncbi:MAG: cytochrome C, partial [Campylobacterota bacterium]|nr:cytochrome C [Campylobacterota bacterium]